MQNKPHNNIEIDWSIRFVRLRLGYYVPDTIPAIGVTLLAIAACAGLMVGGIEAADRFGMPELRYGCFALAFIFAIAFFQFADRRVENPLWPWNR